MSIKHYVRLAVISGGLLAHGWVLACSDDDCQLPLRVEFKKQDLCPAAGSVLLNPGNDTRINLALLLEDQGMAQLPPQQSVFPVPFLLRGMPADSVDETPDKQVWQQKLQRLGVAEDLILRSWDLLGAWKDGLCVSNNLQSASAFIDAVSSTDALPVQDKKWLVEERLAMADICSEELSEEDTEGPQYQSERAQAFSSYLSASAAFYSHALDDAATGFNDLSRSSEAWLAEASTYMLARVALNQAQVGAEDEYGFFDPAKIQQPFAQKAQQQLDAYLKRYPDGRYARSARGLYRKAFWFGGDMAALAQHFDQALHAPAQFQSQSLPQWLNEVDNKFLFSNGIGKSPLGSAQIPWAVPDLAAVIVLARMRNLQEEGTETPFIPLAPAELALQKSAFSDRQKSALFAYLQLAHQFFVEQNLAQVLALTEKDPLPESLTNLAMSRFALRALALERQQHWLEARKLWLELRQRAQRPLQQSQLQLALAVNFESAGQVALAFADDSPVVAFELRQALLRFSATPELLEQRLQAATASQQEKTQALFSLLYKSLLVGDYGRFKRILNQYPVAGFPDLYGLRRFDWAGQSAPNYPCPSLMASVERLLTEPSHAQSHNCVAEFLFRNQDQLVPGDKPTNAQTLGGQRDGFAGVQRGRLDWYLPILAQTNVPDDDKAYALYRAINCFASSGNNQCGSQSIPPEQRKAWFRQLKSSFGSSSWAQAQKYYW